MKTQMPITLYSYMYCPFSHRCRIVFNEKEMGAGEIREVNINDKPPELEMYNPYNQVPVLVDRENYFYESNIINEYLDDRFPHPQLMPPDIVERAKVRLMLHDLDAEIFPHLRKLVLQRSIRKERAQVARRHIVEGLMKISKMIPKGNRYFIGKDFTMLDVALAPLLWRLEFYNIRLPQREALPLLKYAERIFSRKSFIDSMSVVEKSMRK